MIREQEDANTYWLVIARDSGFSGVPLCIRCGKVADDVHEIIPRSAFGKGSKERQELFAMSNRCCLCRECHKQAHNRKGRGELLSILNDRYKYEYTGARQCLLLEYRTKEMQEL